MLLEASRNQGGNVDVDSIGMFRGRVPGAHLYTWDRKRVRAVEQAGTVHAKCVVADERIAFITSANLTSAALERNMEIGILVRGGALPGRLYRHLRALVTTRIVQRV